MKERLFLISIYLETRDDRLDTFYGLAGKNDYIPTKSPITRRLVPASALPEGRYPATY